MPLTEPTMPVREEYSSDEQYRLALALYKDKLKIFLAKQNFLEDITQEGIDKEQREIQIVKTMAYQIHEVFKDISFESCCVTDEEGENAAFKPAKAATEIDAKQRFKTDFNSGILYYFDGRTWIREAEPYLKIAVARILLNENRVSHYNNILHHLEGLSLDKIEFSKKIACLNGLLDVETGQFTEYSPESKNEMPFYSIPVTYDPNAKCPNWNEFVKQVVTADDIVTLQEWSGYCLLPNYSFHKMMWIVGSGRNGKGVWQRTIENILGPENTANIGLEEFDGSHRFALYNLYGKLVNFCSEPKTNKELQTNLLKYATGQDTIEAEVKGKQKRLSFKNCAKITVLANKFPKVNDQTTAFKERRLFLKFPNEFIGSNQIQNLEQNWLNKSEERSGILNWMLQGLKRLLEQGQFSTSRTQEQTELEFLRASDSISAFINETATFDRHVLTTRAEAKTAYEAYCDYYGLEIENEKKLSQRLKDTPKVKNSNTRIHGTLERAWIGISFKIMNIESESEAQTEPEPQKKLDFDTHDTDDTGVSNPLNFSKSSENNKESVIPVSSVSSVSDSISGYSGALTCVFCSKAILDDNWTRDGFTWDKPAHKSCYDEKKEQLANQDSKGAA